MAQTPEEAEAMDLQASTAAKTAGDVAPAKPSSGFRYAFSSLKNRDFLYLWLGMLCLMGGVQMQMIARGYLVYDITERPVLLGVVNAGMAVPILVLALFGGAIADRFDRKRIVQGGQALNMTIALVVAILITTNTVTWIHLLAASMIQGGMWSFMMPARQAIIPEIVGEQNITNALALNAAGMSAMTLLSPALGGTLYASLGPDGVYYVITGLGFMAVVFTTMVGYEGSGPARPDVAMVGDIKEGLSHIMRNPMVLLLLAMALVTTLFAMPFRLPNPSIRGRDVRQGTRGPGTPGEHDGAGLAGRCHGYCVAWKMEAGTAVDPWQLYVRHWPSDGGDISNLPGGRRDNAHPRPGGCYPPYPQPDPHDGGRRRPLPGAADGRIHDELRLDAPGRPARCIRHRGVWERKGSRPPGY